VIFHKFPGSVIYVQQSSCFYGSWLHPPKQIASVNFDQHLHHDLG